MLSRCKDIQIILYIPALSETESNGGDLVDEMLVAKVTTYFSKSWTSLAAASDLAFSLVQYFFNSGSVTLLSAISIFYK